MSARQEQLLQAQTMVEQLRQQAVIERQRVSVSIQGLVEYVNENEREDPLINPLAKSENPFNPKTPCVIL